MFRGENVYRGMRKRNGKLPLTGFTYVKLPLRANTGYSPLSEQGASNPEFSLPDP